MKPRPTTLTRTPIRPADTGWEKDALCRRPAADPAWWDHDGPKHPDGRKAVTWCAACPVRADCLKDAEVFERDKLFGDLQGVRGGLGVRDRYALYRRKDAADAERAAQDTGAAA